MKTCIAIFKHIVTLVFVAVCAYEVSHVITKWMDEDYFQGKIVLEIPYFFFKLQLVQKSISQ